MINASGQKCLILDRDGVINPDTGYTHKIEEFSFFDGVFETCREAQKQGYLIVITTNQAGIAKGHFTEEKFLELTEWMLAEFRKEGVEISAVYHCPYHADAVTEAYRHEDHPDRKPNPGMLLRAKEEFGLDMQASIMVGDKESDIQAGKRAGVGTTIRVLTGESKETDPTDADMTLHALADVKEVLVQRGRGAGWADIVKSDGCEEIAR